MSVIKEWRCAVHGDFERSHPICPSFGCASDQVERIFKTPVGISKGLYNRFDRGMRHTADRAGIGNFRTVREGETSFAGRAPLGQEVLWGNDIAKAEGFGGKSFAELRTMAQAPLSVPGRDPGADPHLTHNNGMRTTATELGITKRVLPTAEFVKHKADSQPQ